MGAASLTVTKPDGSTVDLFAEPGPRPSVSFSQTDQLGVYMATPTFGGGRDRRRPAAPPIGTADARADGVTGTSATPVPTAPPADPNAPARFAVDLFDVDESTIAPGSPAALEALGGARSAPVGFGVGDAWSSGPVPTGATSGAGSAGDERPPARDELWVPIVLLVLLVLSVEWLAYQRDAVLRLWRGFRKRVAPGGGT